MLASTVWVLKVYQFKPLSWTLSTLEKQSKKLPLTLRILIQYSWKYLRYTEPHQTIHSYTSTQSSSSPGMEPPKKQPNKIRSQYPYILCHLSNHAHTIRCMPHQIIHRQQFIVALKTNSQHNSPLCTSTCTTDQHTTTFYVQDNHYKLAKHSDF